MADKEVKRRRRKGNGQSSHLIHGQEERLEEPTKKSHLQAEKKPELVDPLCETSKTAQICFLLLSFVVLGLIGLVFCTMRDSIAPNTIIEYLFIDETIQSESASDRYDEVSDSSTSEEEINFDPDIIKSVHHLHVLQEGGRKDIQTESIEETTTEKSAKGTSNLFDNSNGIETTTNKKLDDQLESTIYRSSVHEDKSSDAVKLSVSSKEVEEMSISELLSATPNHPENDRGSESKMDGLPDTFVDDVLIVKTERQLKPTKSSDTTTANLSLSLSSNANSKDIPSSFEDEDTEVRREPSRSSDNKLNAESDELKSVINTRGTSETAAQQLPTDTDTVSEILSHSQPTYLSYTATGVANLSHLTVEEPDAKSVIHSRIGDKSEISTESLSDRVLENEPEPRTVTHGVDSDFPETKFRKSEIIDTSKTNLDSTDSVPQSPTETDELDSDASRTPYAKSDITSTEDFIIRDKLDDIDSMFLKFPEKALAHYKEILSIHPSSPRALYGMALCMDKIAESRRSNKILEEAIDAYQDVLVATNVPEKLYLEAGFLCVKKMQFRGYVGKSVKLLGQMAIVYPKNVDIKNKIGVGYLLIGQNKHAKRVFLEVLQLSPSNGFAKVHLGFIAKTDDSNYEEAIKLLSDGISSREDGVIDGRFFFHLGDALARTGKNDQAMKVYEQGTKEGLFLSPYQRSLYNVKGLTAKPWWNPKDSGYAHFFDVLEKNWVAIRDEALSLINEKTSGFQPESEGLQDGGNWKQFDMFSKGKKIGKNCDKAPFTCALVQKMPDASQCKRGQVKFSIMQPDTHVWAHVGPTNCRLRAHLGLVVPVGTRLRVANETKTWQEGKVILFDDSFEHEVWHTGTSLRLVLIIDFWHPELTKTQRASLSPI